jgi:hypothetical protein
MVLQRGEPAVQNDEWSATGTRLPHRVGDALLLTGFLVASAARVVAVLDRGEVGIDLRVYRAAAVAAISGHDPWAASASGVAFAAPPSSLLPYLPAALLPEPVAITAYACLFLGVAIAVIRRMRLPLWWLLFTPLVDSLLVLNLDVLVIALLLAPGWLGGFAIPMKIYSALPVLLQRRWTSAFVGVAVLALAGPLWIDFFERLPSITSSLALQSAGGLSAWGTLLVVPTLFALWVLRARGASWLVVPGLWPATQLHYATIALPAARTRRVLAFLLCFAVPGLPAVAIIAEALLDVIKGKAV